MVLENLSPLVLLRNKRMDEVARVVSTTLVF
nr:MAG TPA: hypothetical protein [Caudoviricetes sp.]